MMLRAVLCEGMLLMFFQPDFSVVVVFVMALLAPRRLELDALAS